MLWAGDGDGLGAGGVAGGARAGAEGAALLRAAGAPRAGDGAESSAPARPLWCGGRGLGAGVAAAGASVPAGRATFWLVVV